MFKVFFTTFCLLVFFSIYVNGQENHKEFNIYFDYNSSKINVQAKQELQKIKDFFNTQEDRPKCFYYEIQITAYADSTGTFEDNLKLSKKRAEALESYFNRKDFRQLDIKKLEVNYKGEINSEKVLAKNRRCEIVIKSIECPDIEAPTVTPSPVTSTSKISDLYAQTIQKAQVFTINNLKDTLILCEQGTAILFPAKCFIGGQQKCSQVQIEVQEFYKTSDMILNNMSTSSAYNKGYSPLETGGMLNVVATCNDKKVDTYINPTVFVPTEEVKEDMLVFKGVWKGKKDEELIDWQVQNLSGRDELNNGMLGGGIRKKPCFLARKSQKSLWKTYREVINKKRKKEIETLKNQDNIKSASKELLNYYIFESKGIGYMNCDRFVKNNKKKVSFVVDMPRNQYTDVKLVFKKYNSILPYTRLNTTQYFFSQVPLGEKVTVVAIQYLNNVPYIAIREATTSERKISLEPKEVTFDELDKMLEQLN